MKAIELFSAGIRLFGLYLLGRASLDIGSALLTELGIYERSVGSNHPFNEWVVGFGCLFVGLYLLRGAPHLVDYAFPVKDNDDPHGGDDIISEEDIELEDEKQ